ncbi:hypothetical protein [Streptomyces sp. M92]|uniref:hypothetical protein n=1 Tax=Streptomyces sp. M92 TaxID=2944250 RepID=UPI002349E0EC|nr:hypothetical protein [Streptomyces sp. M92]WCN05169.1 hypothetical protein M6G08_25390 [Streptomyces sp. M92]
MTAVDPRVQGREAYERLAWRDAYEQLSAAEQQAPLTADDLVRMARAAYLIGSVDAATETWEGAHHAFLAQGDAAPAVRCAFWIGLTLVLQGERTCGGGWLARARHMLEDTSLDCVEQGYLRIPAALRTLDGGEPEAARRLFAEVTEIADRFDDADLRAFGGLGRARRWSRRAGRRRA